MQDRIFAFLDNKLFPHKTYKSFVSGIKESRFGLFGALVTLVMAALLTAAGLASSTIMMGLGVIALSAVLFAVYGQFLIRKEGVNG